MKRSVAAGFAVLFTLVVCAHSASQAQFPDHLQCHKIKDTKKFADVVVDLSPTQVPPFAASEGCRISNKPRELCIPTEKTVVQAGNIQPPGVLPATYELISDYLCYKVKCPKRRMESLLITDQFGSRNVENVRAAGRVCIPTVKGIPTTTTTTVPPPQVSGSYQEFVTFPFGTLLPGRAQQGDPDELGDRFDEVVSLVANPGDQLWNWIREVDALNNALPPDVGNLDSVAPAILNAVVLDAYPSWSANAALIAGDVRALIDEIRLGGDLTIVDEPDVNGQLAANQSHSYYSTDFDWRLPCADSVPDDCPAITQYLPLLTGDLALAIESAWAGSVASDALTISPHALTVPFGLIATSIVDSWVMPEIADDPTIDSPEAAAEQILGEQLLRYYNASHPGDPLPEPYTGCVWAEEAFARLLVEQGIDVAVAIAVRDHACQDGPPHIAGEMATLRSEAASHSVDNLSVATATPCTLSHTDADGRYDKIGDVAPARCTWSVSLIVGPGTEQTTGLFHAVRSGL